MNIKPILKAANLLVRIVGMGVINGILMIHMAFAAGPVWWLDRGVYQIDPGTGLPKASIDFNAVNVGQLKHFARAAYDELVENVEADMWETSEGEALETMVKSWYEDPETLLIPKSTSKDFALLSQGQLKNVARLFYDILHLQGVDVSQATSGQTYPWTELSDDDKSYAPLTSGQLKQVFSFNLDTDDDDIPDWWESKIVSANGSDAIGSNVNVSGSADFDNDGLTNLQEFQEGTSATSYTSSVPSSGLKVWLQGDAGVTTDSGVTGWQNQSASGSGFNFSGHTSTSSRRPGVAYDTTTRKNVIRFNGTDQYLKGPDIGTHDIKNDFTAFFVARPASGATHDIDTVATTGTDGKGSPHKRYLYFGDALNDNDAQVALSVGTNGVSIYENFNVSGSQVMPARAVLNAGTNGISPNSTFDIIEMKYASKAPSISIDGQTPTTGSAFSGRNNAYFGKSLGGPETYSADYGYFNGDVAEVIVYNRVLNAIERQNVLNHLRLRWMDTDNDGLTDGWEVTNGFDPNDIYSADPANAVADGSFDTDGDGFTNRREFELGSDPRNAENNLDVVTIGRWKMDEGSGTLAGDSSGKDNHGIISEGATWTTGMDNSKALTLAGATTVGVLDASDNELDLGANPSFTVSFWFKTTGTGVQRVVGKGDAFDQWTNGISAGVGLLGAGKVGLRLGGGTQAQTLQFATSDAFNDGAWHHAAITVDNRAEKAYIYVDGVARNLVKGSGTGGTITTTQISTTGLASLNGTSTQKMYFGGRPGSSEFFTGSIDDIRILNQPLQSAEALALYTKVDGDQDGMPNWWELAHGLNPASNADKTTDLDADGITNINEFKNGTNPVQVAKPQIAKASGAYPVRFNVAVTSATSGATVRYTTNGSDPVETSPVVPSGGVAVNWNMSLKARAFKDGQEASEVASVSYTLTGAVAAGYNHTLLLRTDTKMMGWGSNTSKQVSNGGAAVALKVPIPIPELNSYNLQAIAAGTDHSIGLTTVGKVAAWGANNYRQSGSTSGNTTPALIQSIAGGDLGAGSTPIIQISAGSNFNASLRSDGTVWTWGANTAGHLGIGSIGGTEKHQAHQVRINNTPTYLDDIVRIATGESFTIALDQDGTVWSWGYNGRGQLGINTSGVDTDKNLAQHISSSLLSGVVDVGTGNEAAFAIKNIDGNPANYELYAWGDHTYHELGVSSTANVIDEPARVVLNGNTPAEPLKGVVAVVGGENHTIALKHDGTVWGWGITNHGRIGYVGGETLTNVTAYGATHPTRRYPAPVKINATTVLDDVVWIGAGQNYSVALKRDGSVIVFGYNDQGQHGIGITSTSMTTLAGKFSWHTLADSSDLEDGDNDGYADAYEIANGSDPADANPLDDGPTEAPAIPVPTFVVDENGGADFSTIREALQAVTTEHAIILVEPGTYYGPITLEGHKILLKSTKGASETIIDAVQEAPAVKFLTEGVISGFTIKNAFGDKNGMVDTGGAIYVDGCRPIIDRCYVTANRALNGAVMFNNAGMPIIRSSTMAFNKSVNSTPGGTTLGAAIYSKGFQPLIQNSILFNDTPTETDGAVSDLGATVQGCVVKNSTDMDGDFPTSPFVPGGNKLVTTNTNTSGSLKLLESGHLVSGSAAIGVGSSELPRIADVDGEVKSSGDPAAGMDEYVDSEPVQGVEGLPDWWERENEEAFANDNTTPPTPLSPTLDDADVAVNAESVTAQNAYNAFVSDALNESGVSIGDEPQNTVIIVNDDSSGTKDAGGWSPHTTGQGVKDGSYKTCMNENALLEFIPEFTDAASYRVAMWWPKGDFHKAVEVEVHTATGVYPLKVDQSKDANSWRELGIFAFTNIADESVPHKVVIKVPKGSTKLVAADAVQFTKVSPAVELRTAVASASNIDGTYLASKTGSKSHWNVRNIANITGVTSSKVRISRNTSGVFRFKPKLKVAGHYKVYLRWQQLQKSTGAKFYNAGYGYSNPNDGKIVPVDIVHSNSTSTVMVNQNLNRGEWVLLSTSGNPTGVYEFPASDPGDNTAPQVVVRVPSGMAANTWVTADAVRFEKVSNEGVIVDDAYRGTNMEPFGTWTQKIQNEFSKKPSGFARGYNILSGTPLESDHYEYIAKVSKPGNYGVYVYGPTGKAYSSAAAVSVNGQEMSYSQRIGGERWRPLGEVSISGKEAVIQIRRTDVSSNVGNNRLIADAVALVRDPDNDHDGLTDVWEEDWGFRTDRADQDYNEQVDGLDDFDGDGITNVEEEAGGSDPLDAYNGNDIEIQKISGDRLTGEPNTIVGPLRVRVVDSSSNPRMNSPVTFMLPVGPPAGSGLGISPTWGFSSSDKLTVRTDYEGYAEVYVCLPEYGGVDFEVVAKPGTIDAAAQTFRLGVSGLTAHWSLDEMAGTLIGDTSGFNHYGSLTTSGAEWSSAGEQVWRKAVRFTSTSGKILIANGGYDVLPENSSTVKQAYSMAFWFRPESSATTQRAIMTHALGSGNIQVGIVADTSNGPAKVYVSRPSGGGQQDLITSGTVPLNQWNHVILTNDGTTVRLHVNGNLIGSLSNNWATGGLGTHTSDIQFGGSSFVGSVDDIRVYRGVLGYEQIIGLFSADSDGDGMSNDWEIANGLDMLDGADAMVDADGDGVTNLGESRLQTNPHSTNTVTGVLDGSGDADSDGMTDGWEANYGLNYTQDDAYDDGDGDLYPNIFEFAKNTDPKTWGSIPAADITVDGQATKESSTEFIKIKNAIAGLQNDYEIIKVNPGVYEESISTSATTKKFLLISAEGARKTTIDGTGQTDGGEPSEYVPVLTLATNAVIAGFGIKGSGSGIGGGVKVLGSAKVHLINNYIHDNRANESVTNAQGAGIWAGDTSSVRVIHSTIVNNADGTLDAMGNPATIDSAIWAASGASIHLINSIAWNPNASTEIYQFPQVTAEYSCIRGGFTGTGNINADPKLTPDGHLKTDSPSRDVTGAALGIALDWDNESRGSNLVDLGVDEFVDTDGDGAPDYWEEENEFDALDARDGGWDADSDDVTNAAEYAAGTSPWGGAAPYELESQTEDLDTTTMRVVGSTQGELSVGSDGSSGYNVPLFIPKGTGNMEPKLGLAYSSNAGNGNMGLGWSLTGLSTITRGGTTIAQDGLVKGVNLSSSDQFYLDGQRLICYDGSPGSVGAEYDTEIRSFAKVKILASNKWEMRTKSGLTTTYKPVISTTAGVPIVWGIDRVTDDKGNYFEVTYLSTGEPDKIAYTGNSTILAPYNEVRFIYNNNRVDKRVNYIGGVKVWQKRLLQKIEMHSNTGGSSMAIAREYRFFYRYSGSTSSSNNAATPNGYARLVRLQELGAVISGQERQSFKDLYFDWQGWSNADRGWQSTPSWNVPKFLADDNGATGVIFMDVNADGFPDMIWNRHEYHETNRTLFSKGAFLNPGRPGVAWINAPKFAPPYPLVAEGGADTGARFGDFNGDGFEDLIGRGEYVVYKHDGDPEEDRLAPNDTEIDARSGIWALNPLSGWIKQSSNFSLRITKVDDWQPDPNRSVHFQDLNGDGKPEVLYGNGDTTTIWKFNMWDMVSAGPASTFDDPIAGVNHGFADVTGDGLPDLIFNKEGAAANGIYTFTQSSPSSNYTFTKVNAGVTVPYINGAYKDAGGKFLDLNGDGITDYWYKRRTGDDVVKLGTGVKVSNSWEYAWGESSGEFDFQIPDGVYMSLDQDDTGNLPVDIGNRFADLNGDGLVDMMTAWKHVSGSQTTTKVKTFINTGTGFEDSSTWRLPDPDPQHFFAQTELENNKFHNVSTGVQLVDINADGFTDVVQSREDGEFEFKSVHINKAKPQKIIQVRNGNGSRTLVSYKPLTNSAVYTHNIHAPSTNPDEKETETKVRSSISPVHVVEKVKRDNGLGKYLTVRYHYSGLQTDLEGRGSRGFKTMKVTDDNPRGAKKEKLVTTTTYLQAFPRKGNILSSVTRIIKNGGALGAVIARTDNEWSKEETILSTNRVGGGKFKLYSSNLTMSKVVSNDPTGKLLTSTTTTSVYDAWGNLKRGKVESGAGTSKATENTYHPGDDALWKGRLASSEVKHVAPGTPDITRKSGFTYENGDTGRLHTEETQPGATDSPITEYEYDDFGNVIKTETTGRDIKGIEADKDVIWETRVRSAQTEYDGKGRFAVSTKSKPEPDKPEHKVETTGINHILGVPTEVTDANGHKTATSYDTFGRVKVSMAVETGIENVTETYYAEAAGSSTDPIVRNVLYKVKTYQKKGSVVFPASVTWFDRLNRVLRKEAETPESTPRIIYQDTRYNYLGQVSETSTPYFKDDPSDVPLWTTLTYDTMGRTVKTEGPDEGKDTKGKERGKAVTSYTYAALKTNTVKKPKGEYLGGVVVTGTLRRGYGEDLITVTTSNAAGQVIHVQDAHGKKLYYYYDATGAQKVTSYDREHSEGSPNPDAVVIDTDIYGRKTKMTDPDKGTWEYEYNDFGELIKQVDAKGQVDFTFRDELGRVTETLQTVISHTSNTPPDRHVVTTYDTAPKVGGGFWKGLVHQVELRVPNTTGDHNVDFDGDGKITDTNIVIKTRDTSTYNNLGRIIQTTSERLTSQIGTTAVTPVYATYTSSQTYDAEGRPDETTYPTGVKTKNFYNEKGFHYMTKRLAFTPVSGSTASEQMLWHVDPAKITARGQVTEQRIGGTESGGVVSSKVVLGSTYHPVNGRMMTMNAIPTSVSNPTLEDAVQHNSYDYDLIGTVRMRRDLTGGATKEENFTYDKLNRLDKSQVVGDAVKDFGYEDNGNINCKPGIGTYIYGRTDGAGPHAVTQINLDGMGGSVQQVNYTYDANGNMTEGPAWGYDSNGRVVSSVDRTITYYQNDKPRKITETAAGTTVDFDYGAADELIYKKSVTTAGGTVETRYLGAYEIEIKGTVETHRHHFGTEVFTYTKNGSSHSFATNFILKDHLGSTEVILDGNGAVVTRYSYDAFGLRRNSDWSDATERIVDVSDTQITNKGYTGHEMLDEVELIHMGGRVYDPIIGRFLSADPFIQSEANPQSFNRYSYVQNNPLTLTDPSGYFSIGELLAPFDFSPLLVQLHIQHHEGIEDFMERGIIWFQENPEVAQVVIIVVAAVVTWGVGTVAAAAWGSFAGAVVGGAAGGFTSGALSAAVAGAKGSDIWMAGLKQAGISAVSAGLAYGVGHAFPVGGGNYGSFGQYLDFGKGSIGDTIATGLAHGVMQGALGEATGGDFVSGFVSAFAGHVGGAIMPGEAGDSLIAVRTVIAATIGGTAAELTGGDFANGAMTAAYVHLFNVEVPGVIKRVQLRVPFRTPLTREADDIRILEMFKEINANPKYYESYKKFYGECVSLIKVFSESGNTPTSEWYAGESLESLYYQGRDFWPKRGDVFMTVPDNATKWDAEWDGKHVFFFDEFINVGTATPGVKVLEQWYTEGSTTNQPAAYREWLFNNRFVNNNPSLAYQVMVDPKKWKK